jgi:type I restriction enzyme S subunit
MMKYDSYKDSGVEWIGKIPIHWDRKRLKHISESVNGYSFKSDDFDREYDIPVIRIGDVGDTIDFDNCVKVKSHFLEEKSEFIVKKDDILIGLTGGTIGKSGRYNYDSPSLLNQRVGLLRNKESVLNGLLHHYVNSEVFIRYIFFDCYGGGQDNISMNDILNMVFPFPPLSEQQQIVSFLDTKTSLIVSLIEKTQQKIELLKEKRTSLINEVITKGLNPNVEMKDSGVEWIGEIPSHWEKIKLHTLVTSQKLEFQDGNHGELHPIPEEFLEIGVPFIKPKDIQKEKVLWDSCDRLPFERCEQFRIGFSNNDDVLLVNRGGSIGKVVYVSDYDNEFPYFVINPQVTYLRGKNGLLSKYIFYISISDIFQCGIDLIMGHGSTFPFLGLSNMGDFEIVFPNISEQQQIVSYLDEQTQLIDNTISIEEKRIELLKEYRQSLISEVVTGKRKVVE